MTWITFKFGLFIVSTIASTAPSAAADCSFNPKAPGYAIDRPTRGSDARRHDDIFFDASRFALTDEARLAIGADAAFALKTAATSVVVWGYTDTVGAAQANERLSFCRAIAVADELARLGVRKNFISVWGAGETSDYQAVGTADEVREPRNNHVTIDIE